MMLTYHYQNLFGSTECSVMLLSEGGCGPSARFLRPLKGVNYGFFPVTSSAQGDAVHVSANSQLLELVILSNSPDCPDPSMRSKDDGHFHTGDLFLDMGQGHYLARGRDDDWIKSLNSLRCDTKAIEDNVRATCSDLIEECIVVGSGRPSPALFLEASTNMSHDRLKREIIRRTRPFHVRRYLHEQITSEEFIIVVERKTLPRTAVSLVPFSLQYEMLSSSHRLRETFGGKQWKKLTRSFLMKSTIWTSLLS